MRKRADSLPLLPTLGAWKQEVSNCLYGSLLEPLPGSQVTTTRAPTSVPPVRSMPETVGPTV